MRSMKITPRNIDRFVRPIDMCVTEIYPSIVRLACTSGCLFISVIRQSNECRYRRTDARRAHRRTDAPTDARRHRSIDSVSCRRVRTYVGNNERTSVARVDSLSVGRTNETHTPTSVSDGRRSVGIRSCPAGRGRRGGVVPIYR